MNLQQLMALMVLALSVAASQAQTEVAPITDKNLKEFADRLKEMDRQRQQGGSECRACPSACELVCDAKDTECIARLQKERKRLFEECAKRK